LAKGASATFYPFFAFRGRMCTAHQFYVISSEAEGAVEESTKKMSLRGAKRRGNLIANLKCEI